MTRRTPLTFCITDPAAPNGEPLMTDTYSLVCSEPDGRGVAELVFGSGRPVNAFTLDLIDAFLALVRRIEGRTDIRVLVIRSAVASFSGGADLGAMGSMSAETYQRYIAAEFELFAAIEGLPLVTIAALAGACLGNAAELALIESEPADPAAGYNVYLDFLLESRGCIPFPSLISWFIRLPILCRSPLGRQPPACPFHVQVRASMAGRKHKN